MAAVSAEALEMEGQTLRGPELYLAGHPAQQVSEEGAGLQVLKLSSCLVVGEALTPHLVFSRGQTQREGLGDCTLEGLLELANLHTPPPPDFLRRKQVRNWEATPERRSFGRTCPLPDLLPQGLDARLVASVGSVWETGALGFTRSPPEADREQFAYFTRLIESPMIGAMSAHNINLCGRGGEANCNS